MDITRPIKQIFLYCLKAALLLGGGGGFSLSAQWARVYTSTPDRLRSLHEEVIQEHGSPSADDAIVIASGAGLNQEVDGYGWAITYAACRNLMRIDAASRHALLVKTYSPTEGYGVSYARIAIGGHDFSSDEYTYCEEKGPEADLLRNFSFTSDETDYVIPILKEILELNPALKIIAAPWTPPRWMKYHEERGESPDSEGIGDWTGGRLRPKYYRAYGEYFVRFIREMAANGITVHAVSPQNEPLNWGNSSSMYMPWEDEAAFVKEGLAPALHDAGLPTKIYIYDHNYNYDNDKKGNGNYVTKVYGRILDTDFPGKELMAGSCWHNYGGRVEDIAQDVVWGDWSDMELLFTEASIGEWNNADDLYLSLSRDMDELVIAPALHRFRGSLGWNMMLDSDFGPHRGPGACETCHGALDLILDRDGNPSGEIRPTSQYYAMAHASAVVKPGARRVDTSGWWADGLSYAAFRNPDNTTAILFANSGDTTRNVKVDADGHTYLLEIPAKGVVSARMGFESRPTNSVSLLPADSDNASHSPRLYDLSGRKVETPVKGAVCVTSDGDKEIH